MRSTRRYLWPPRVKFESPDGSDDETDDDKPGDDAPTATPSASDPVDNDSEVSSSLTQSLADQVHALNARFNVYWDESHEHQVALSRDMDSIRAKMAAIRACLDQITQQLTQLLSFHTAPPPPPP